MAYIYLEELKKILPGILDQWVDKDDESWEWIFQEIEQKCHVGKKKKDKKKRKAKIDSLIMKYQNLNKEVEEMHREFIDTKNNVIQLGLSMKDMGAEIKHVREDSKAAKLMAQTARDRTQIDYSKYSGKSDGNINYSKEKSDADVVQEVYNRMAGRGATREELDTFRNLIHKYDALEKKEIPVTKVVRDCGSCKHDLVAITDEPCSKCLQHRPELPNWEAKYNG